MIEITNIRFFRLTKASFRVSLFVSYFWLLASGCLLPASVSAQDEMPANVVAPPIISLAKDEKARVESETDLKKRTKLAIDLMEIRLKNAETLNAEENFADMFTELGFFHALMNNTLNFLDRNNQNKNKVLSNYKRFEMSLRTFIARLEVIRRELPLRYEYYVRSLVKLVRQARSRAIEPFFDNQVVPNNIR